jgi:tetratricopeptide (TPR) repeat protein
MASGSLLYNRYAEQDNQQAIERFTTAAASSDRRLQALSLSGLTLACAQNVHRFGLGSSPWVAVADEASSLAVQIDPTLEETSFARAWAHQIADRVAEALDWYKRTTELPGDTPIERQIKSFAQNNRAWLYMTKLEDLDTAEHLLRDARDRFWEANKMVHANLGEIHKRRKEFDAARSAYERARTLDPSYANAINETGMLYLAMARDALDRDRGDSAGLLDEAMRWHQRALEVVIATAKHERNELRRKFDETCWEVGFSPPHDVTSPPSPEDVVAT